MRYTTCVSSQLAAVYVPLQIKLHVCIFTSQQTEKYYLHLGFTSVVGFTQIVRVEVLRVIPKT